MPPSKRLDGEQVEEIEAAGDDPHHHGDVGVWPSGPDPEGGSERHGHADGGAHDGGEDDLALRGEAHARHGDGAEEGQEHQPAPGLADEPVGEEMAELVDEQGRHQQGRDEPAEGEHEGIERDDAGDERDAGRDQGIGAVVGRARLGDTLQAEHAAPQVGAGEKLGQQRARAPVIGEGEARAAVFGD